MIEADCPHCRRRDRHPIVRESPTSRDLVTVECRNCFAEFSVEVYVG